MEIYSRECYCDVIGNKRYLLAVLLCVGLISSYAMRCEFGIAIIKMTESHTVYIHSDATNSSSQLVARNVTDVTWSYLKVGFIEASFYIGYSIFSIPGGFLSTIFAPNLMLCFSVMLSATLNAMIPFCIHLNSSFAMVFSFRVLQGMAEGCFYPCIHSFWRYWAPRQERSKLVSISFFGIAIGPVIGYPISGILTKQFSWTINFYFWSVISLIWVSIWFVVSKRCPSDDNSLSEAEREYIESNTTQLVVRSCDVPWVSIFTSLPVWAIIFANVGRNWTHQFAFSGLPTFLHEKFRISSLKLGFHMSAPYLLMAILTPTGGIIADCMIKRSFTVVCVRKLLNSVGFGVGGLSIFILGFIPNVWVTSTFITIGLGLFGIGVSGFGINHLDISDMYAGVLMGISNGLGTIAGILSPIVALEISKRNPGNRGWIIFFILSGFIHIATVIFFYFFASGDNQPWNKQSKVTENTDDERESLLKD